MKGKRRSFKWKITNSRFKLIISLEHTLKTGCINKKRDKLNSMFGYRNHHQTEFRVFNLGLRYRNTT